jgi:Cu+-exporting ATPase
LAGKFGILARGGGEAFQEMAQLDLVVFDKTGTLTEGGEARVSDAEFIPNNTRARCVILGIAAELESTSSHPLATAIRRFCENEGASPQTGSSFEEKAGRGLKASFHTLHCTSIIGNEAWMEEHGAAMDYNFSRRIEIWKSEAKSVILLAIQDELATGSNSGQFQITAIFAVTDPLRTEAPYVISWLQKQGIDTWMISGDNITSAAAVAAAVGIPSTNVIAGVLPHEKVAISCHRICPNVSTF